MALREGRVQAVKLLLGAGVDVNAKDRGITALHEAWKLGHHGMMAMLLPLQQPLVRRLAERQWRSATQLPNGQAHEAPPSFEAVIPSCSQHLRRRTRLGQ